MIHNVRVLISLFKERKKPWKTIWACFLVKTGLNKYLTIKMDSYKLKFSKSALAMALFIDKDDRHNDEDFLRSVLKPGDTYVDVGANIGTLVLTASTAVSNSGNVVGIEAHPTTFQNLKANTSLNKFTNIRLINSAVGDHKGMLFFSDIKSDDQNKVMLKQKCGTEVAVNTLDEMLTEYENISLLKIDVEGYEKYVLTGASDTLKKTNIIFFESCEKHFSCFGYDTGDIIQLLHQSDFEVYKIRKNKLRLLNSNYRSMQCENLLALKDARSFHNQHNFVFSPID